MLSKKLIPVGNSLGLVIDKPILDMLSISKDTELEIRTEGNALIIMPVRKGKDQDRGKSFRDALKWVIEHHGETLQKLSK
jgi:antitoxin MazE